MKRFWTKLQAPNSVSVGLSFTDDEISFCVTKKGTDGLGDEQRVVQQCFSAPSEKGKHSENLKALVSEHKIPKVPITFGLPIGTHTIYAASRPTVESEEVAQAVLWLLKDRLEQPPEDTLLSVVDYPENCRRDEQLMAVAVSKTVVKSYIDIIEQAGLEIGAIDVSELLIGELMNLMPGAEQGLALIAEHSKGVIILVYRSGNLYLFRNLAGIRDLTSCLPSESNKASADQLMLEIQRTLDYYDSQMRQPPLAGIVVAPSLANLSPLVEYLDANLAVNIELLDLNLLLNLSEPLSPAEQADCILSASAAFRSELVS